MSVTMNEKLTQFFKQYYDWTPPWDPIKLTENGWGLIAGKLFCKDNNCTVIALGKRYEIFYAKDIKDFDVILAHELKHIRDMESMGLIKYCIDYLTEHRKYGHKRNKYEVSAIKIMKLYYGWAQTHK